jgi:DNA (cytosine-5)-methyltransferase 1
MATMKIGYTVKGDCVSRTITLPDGRVRRTMFKELSLAEGTIDADAAYDLAWLTSKNMPRPRNLRGEFRVVDLFCGCGGLTLGVREAAFALGRGFRSVFASDINKQALDLYVRNFNPDIVDDLPIENQIDGDLGEELTERERRFVDNIGHIDMLVAGPPCQGNSDLNNHTRRNDPKNLLYLRAVRCAEILSPDSVIIENVPGVLHEKHGVMQTAIAHLSGLGYSVSYGIIPMKSLGVAQNRRRMVLIASKCGSVDINKIIEEATVQERPLSWACTDLLDAYNPNDVFNSSANHSDENKRRIHYLFEHDIHDLPNSERPDCHRLKPHGYVAVYGRMYWNIPSPTITGGFGSCGQGRFVHPLKERTLTPHEAARVQFFPDFFDFKGVPRRELQQVIGNAVPSKAGFVVALPLFVAACLAKGGNL